jgi:hypothetical protein
MGIARHLFKDMFRSFDRFAHTDHPVFDIQPVL